MQTHIRIFKPPETCKRQERYSMVVFHGFPFLGYVSNGEVIVPFGFLVCVHGRDSIFMFDHAWRLCYRTAVVPMVSLVDYAFPLMGVKEVGCFYISNV